MYGPPDGFFEEWEYQSIGSLQEFIGLVEKTFSRWTNKTVQYVWRGAVNAEWSLHSTLYRRVIWMKSRIIGERDLQKIEGEILAEAHRWGLHYFGQSHLTILYELAMLQHFGIPTRLIDVTFNPLIALFFAVEDQLSEQGNSSFENKDGRVFVFDVSTRIINEMPSDIRRWEEAFDRPWGNQSDKQDGGIEDWRTSYWAWRPAPIQERFAAQQSGFIFGGVPQSHGIQWPKTSKPGLRWRMDEVRRSTSIPVRFHKLENVRGGRQGRSPRNPAFTFRIPSGAKKNIRNDLRRFFGIEARTIFPDYPGFAARGTPNLFRELR